MEYLFFRNKYSLIIVQFASVCNNHSFFINPNDSVAAPNEDISDDFLSSDWCSSAAAPFKSKRLED